MDPATNAYVTIDFESIDNTTVDLATKDSAKIDSVTIDPGTMYSATKTPHEINLKQRTLQIVLRSNKPCNNGPRYNGHRKNTH